MYLKSLKPLEGLGVHQPFSVESLVKVKQWAMERNRPTQPDTLRFHRGIFFSAVAISLQHAIFVILGWLDTCVFYCQQTKLYRNKTIFARGETKKHHVNKKQAMYVLLCVCQILKSVINPNNLNGAHHFRCSTSGDVVSKTFPDNNAKPMETSSFNSIQNPAKLAQNRLMHMAHTTVAPTKTTGSWRENYPETNESAK